MSSNRHIRQPSVGSQHGPPSGDLTGAPARSCAPCSARPSAAHPAGTPEVSARGAAYEQSRQRRRRRRRYFALSQGERHSPKRLSSPRSTSASKHTRLSLSSATVLPRWSAVGSQVGRAGGIDPRSHPRRCSFARRSGSRPSPTAVLAHPRSAALWQTEGRSQSSTNSQPLGSQRMPTPAYALTSPWRRRCRRRTLLQ